MGQIPCSTERISYYCKFSSVCQRNFSRKLSIFGKDIDKRLVARSLTDNVHTHKKLSKTDRPVQ